MTGENKYCGLYRDVLFRVFNFNKVKILAEWIQNKNKDVPHFNEKTPEGVFNAEYDCQLDASPYLSIDKIKNWIING